MQVLTYQENTWQEEDVVANAPWSEPELIPEIVVDEIMLWCGPRGTIRAVGVAAVIGDGGKVVERRVVVRFALPPDTAAVMEVKLRALRRGSEH
jgi:hypothetical protein